MRSSEALLSRASVYAAPCQCLTRDGCDARQRCMKRSLLRAELAVEVEVEVAVGRTDGGVGGEQSRHGGSSVSTTRQSPT